MALTSVALRLLQRSSRGGLLLRRRGLSAASAAPASSITSVLEKYGLPPTAAAPSANAAAVERQLCFLKVLGVPNLASAVQRDPQLLERDPRASAPHIDYLLSLGIADIGPIVGRCPQVLSCDVNDDLHRKVAILRALGVRQTGRFVENCPRFAILDVEADMRPSIEYLRSIEGLDLGKVLNELPNAVFGAGRKARLEATVNYLVEECAVPRHRLAKMLARWPALLARDLEADLKPKVAWLKSVGLTSVEHVIERNPRVLGSSLPTLQAKHAFLTTVWKRSVSELEVFPQSLTYSLAYLRKRHGFLKLHGREGKGRLHRLLRTADVLFAKKLAGVDPTLVVTPGLATKTGKDAPTGEPVVPERVPLPSSDAFYRPDIDGLRALAVGAVIVYHLDSKYLPGGFVGVDIFFVISGYVVAASLLRKPSMTASEYFAGFFARRAKRLAPALSVVVFVTAFLLAMLVPPYVPSLDEYYTSGLVALAGGANVYYCFGTHEDRATAPALFNAS
ncbi:membrane associated acyltransferase, partial [Chrysochromulina tobinii]